MLWIRFVTIRWIVHRIETILTIEQILLRIVPLTILSLSAIERIVWILAFVWWTHPIALLSAWSDANLRFMIVQSVSPLLRAVIFVRINSLSWHLLNSTLKVKFIDISRSYTWLVELILYSPLVFDVVGSQRAKWSSVSLVRTRCHAVHVLRVLDNRQALRIRLDLRFGKWWQLVALRLKRNCWKLLSSRINPAHVILLTVVFSSIFIVEGILSDITVIKTISSTIA